MSKIIKEIALGVMGVLTIYLEMSVETFLFKYLEINPPPPLERWLRNLFLANLMSSQVAQSARKLPLMSRLLNLPSDTRMRIPSLKEFLWQPVVFFKTSKI